LSEANDPLLGANEATKVLLHSLKEHDFSWRVTCLLNHLEGIDVGSQIADLPMRFLVQ